jgi:hypothetical protein
MVLIDIKQMVKELPLSQARQLARWLNRYVKTMEQSEGQPFAKNRKIRLLKEHRTNPLKAYRLEGVRCGKDGCRCGAGKLHGPYWYRYWTEGGRTKSEYVGKRLPKAVARKINQQEK